MSADYKKQKDDFLDSLQPDDFRNGASFNQADQIIEQVNHAFLEHKIHHDDHEAFIKKALKNLFREDCQAIEKALDLAHLYLQTKEPK